MAARAPTLFWLGRYVERTEGHLRLLRALHLRLSEAPGGEHPTIGLLRRLLEARGLEAGRPLPDGFLTTLDSAVTTASKIRDRLSMDGWTALNDLSKSARRFAARLSEGDDTARATGILLRKVSDFLRTRPPEGLPRLEGADAMHAWVTAWCVEEAGWVELDPTNGIAAANDHVVVAVGRDYADVAPVSGVQKIAGAQVITQAVDVVAVG